MSSSPRWSKFPSFALGAGALAICLVAVRYGCHSHEDLAAGAAQIRVDGERVSIHARNAAREEVLRELARSARFSVAHDEPLAGQVTLDLESVSIPFALVRIVHDRPYAIHFAAGASSPEQIVVGEVRTKMQRDVGAGTAQVDALGETRPTVDNTRSHPNAPPQTAQPAGAAAIFDPSRRSQRLQDLRAEDPEQRAKAVKMTPPIGTGNRQLEEVLLNDPDARVRAQAARQLGGSEGYASTHALIRAVEDEDPSVAAAALEALVDKGDPSVCPALRAVLKRDLDNGVEHAVSKAIADLEYGVRPLPESPDVVEVVPAPKGIPLPDDRGSDRPSGT